MSMDNLSLSDIASVTRGNEDGFGGNMGFFWIFALLLLAGGGFGGFNNNRYADSALNTFATASSQNEILLGQKFDALGQKVNAIGDGICSSTYALNNSILGEGRAIQTQLSNCCCENQRNTDALRYDMSQMNANTNAVVTAQTQKILDALSQNKIDTLQSQLNNLTMQNAIQNATAGVVKYPMSTTYSSGGNPFCGCGCGF